VQLVPGTIVRLPQVLAMVGLSDKTIYRMMKAGTFPAKVQLSPRSVGWRADDIIEWIATRV
jgi:prophage regulatory protein